ncbi:unnamed protein product [Dimorphilus gyrociliatus]|uniref:Uncharacterized protein n=1 Tax=Dimorphilus gyrociliatus TaxID=2664684 RepID=A0A7I8VF60_9ANNE|nr:unnamed protein product [Dimorphilus gyrociliatus]
MSIEKIYAIIIYVHLLVKFTDSTVFKSCSEAIVTNQANGFYDIQPIEYGSITNIYCQVVNDIHIESTLGNNFEENTTINGYEFQYSYKRTIMYGNFNETQMDEYLRTAGTCSQTMYFYNYFSHLSFTHFIFWDGLIVNYNDAPDGICKCFLRQVCDEDASNELTCRDAGNETHSPSFNHTGKFSVLPQRLPLKKIEAGDTGTDPTGHDEIIHFAVGKLKCSKRLTAKLTVNHFHQCENEKLHVLLDESVSTCMKFKASDFYLNIQTEVNHRKFKILGSNSQCLKFGMVSKDENDRTRQCTTIDNCVYNCLASPIKQYFLYSLDLIGDVEICEIVLLPF